MRNLIINADDYGYSHGINKAVIEAYEAGVVTSTTVLVDGIAADEVSEIAQLENLSVGLHFFPANDDYKAEFDRQVEKLTKLLGRKPDSIDVHKPTTIDHQQALSIIVKYSKDTITPYRTMPQVTFIEDFFAGLDSDSSVPNTDDVSVGALLKILGSLTGKYSELMCHIGYSDDYLRSKSSYNDVREEELKTLLDPRVKQFIEERDDLQLINWNDIKVA